MRESHSDQKCQRAAISRSVDTLWKAMLLAPRIPPNLIAVHATEQFLEAEFPDYRSNNENYEMPEWLRL